MTSKIAHSTANTSAEMTSGEPAPASRQTGSPIEVLLVFLKLGVSCFGGPIAHIGYFREEFVVRRKWLDEQAYVDLVALCQFLPGPASSQVGFSIGVMRAGYRGFQRLKAMARQRSHSIEFKWQVAQEFIAGESLYALSKRHDISRQLIRVWVEKYEAGALDEDAQAADLLQEYEARIAALERMGQHTRAGCTRL